jgi:uncharacterized protein (TIGR00290 family)
MSWSTGKDSAWALYQLQNQPEYELAGLFCTINKEYSRTAMHAVRLELLQMQALSIGLPLDIIEIPNRCSNAEYETIMQRFVNDTKSRSVECFAFGDLFLEDIRAYRIDKLTGTGITPVFPLWNQATDRLSMEMIEGGLKAVITCVDPKQLAKNFVGQIYNQAFLNALPDSVDPCGENGEFHSFVFDAPMFKEKIDISVEEIVERDGFIFADIQPIRR